MYECRHFFEDDCEHLPASSKVKPELRLNAHDAFEHILLVKVPLFEHVGSPPATDKSLVESTVTVSRPSRNMSVPGPDESWMVFFAADVIRRLGIDPSIV